MHDSLTSDILKSAEWIARVLKSSGYLADFTPRSLFELDRFFDEHSRNGEAIDGGLLQDQLGVKIFSIGSYIGEVVRRKLGGEWKSEEGDPEAEINVRLELTSGTICWPVQRTMKRFRNGAEDGIAVWGKGMGLDVSRSPKTARKSWFSKSFG